MFSDGTLEIIQVGFVVGVVIFCWYQQAEEKHQKTNHDLSAPSIPKKESELLSR